MEEVDNIIIHSLRQLGCCINEDVKNLNKFNTELVIEATIKCLEIIRPGIEISKIVPVNMAARFRLCGNLAQQCLELGYKGDIGYQTFLYSTESDLRRVFIFLIEKLPKESDKDINESISKLDKLEKSVATILFKQLSTPWLPHYCHKKYSGVYTRVPYRSAELNVPLLDEKQEFEEYFMKNQLELEFAQNGNYEYLLPSIVSYNAKLSHCKSKNIFDELNWLSSQLKDERELKNKSDIESKDLRLMSRFSLNKRLQERSKFDKDYHDQNEEKLKETLISPFKSVSSTKVNEDEKKLKIEELKEHCDQLRMNISSYQNEIKGLTVQLTQLSVCHQEKNDELQILENHKRIKARTCDLMEDGENNIKKLESSIELEKNKLINLAIQWERHRIPLIEKYRVEKEKYATKANTSQKKLNELRLMRDKERELNDECQMKDQKYSQLLVEVQKQSKEVNRSAYTQRIIEIINNVRKQKDEIDKVLGDTRELQKEINMLTGKLERSFTVVDELIFRDAKTNEASRRAYKLLATLHSDCSELVTLVEETGATLRELRDLEEQIDLESTKNIEGNLQRITADLEQMRQETASLTAQIANKSS